MSRYINELETEKSVDEIIEIAGSYLGGEGFEETVHDGEGVWQKGKGLLTAPQFIKVEPVENGVHIEAWLKWAILPGVYVGEMDTHGALLAIPRKMLRDRVEALETMLRGS